MPDVSSLGESVEGLNLNASDSKPTKAAGLPSWVPPFQVKYELGGHDSKVSCIAISPDGLRIASASWDKTIRLWDLATGASIGDALTGHTHFVRAVVFFPDGKFLASTSTDCTIRIWDLVTLKSEIAPYGKSPAKDAIAISPNSQHLAVGGQTCTIEVLDLRSRGTLFTTARLLYKGSITSIAYSPNGEYIASGASDGAICIRNSQNGDLIGQPFLQQKLAQVTCVVFSPDSSLLATSGSDKTVKIWNVEDDVREPMKVLKRHRISVTGVAFSPDGTQLASCATDGICIWDAASGDPVGAAIACKRALMVLWSPDGKHLVSAHTSLEKPIVILEAVEPVIPEEIPLENGDWHALATSQSPDSNNQLRQERSYAAEFYDGLWKCLPHHKDPNFRKKAQLGTLFDRDWSGYIKKGKYIGEGGFGNVYMGEWSNLPIQYQARAIPGVVVKSIRSAALTNNPSRNQKVLEREVMICSSLRHPNIVPFIGVAFGLSENIQIPSVVSVYMSNGSLKTYCSKNPDILRAPLLLEVGKGIEYLHNFKPKVVHGDIKAENILVDDRGRMRLTDFGLSRMLTEESSGATATTSPTGGTLRWMAPELINPESKTRTISTATDVYAFAMTALEIITGKVPFPEYNDGAVMVAVCVHDERPTRPIEMKNWLWTLVNKCWVREPEKRLSIAEAVEALEDVLG